MKLRLIHTFTPIMKISVVVVCLASNIITSNLLTSNGFLPQLLSTTVYGSTKASTQSANEVWKETGLTPAIARNMLISDQRCHQTVEQGVACFNAVQEVIHRYRPNYYLVADDTQGQIITSVDDIRLVDVPNPSSALKAQMKSSLAQYVETYPTAIYSVVLPLWDWALHEVVPKDQKNYAASMLFNGYYQSYYDRYARIEPDSSFVNTVDSTSQDFVGIGVHLEATANELRVVGVLPGSPAQTAGLRVGDVITDVDGHSSSDHDQVQLIDLFSGLESSEVAIKVVRGNETLHIRAVRQRISVPYVTVEHHRDRGDQLLSIIRISTFMSKHICNEVRKGIEEAINRDSAGLVLDLRGNSGGLVTEATCVADLLLPEGLKLLSYRHLTKQARAPEPIFSTITAMTDLPVVVIQDEASASAAEILAVVLQDYERALIVGRPSYGKGIVQTVFDWMNEEKQANLNGITDVRMYKTTEFYISPNGRIVHHSGVVPDILVDSDAKLNFRREKDMPGSPPVPADYQPAVRAPARQPSADCQEWKDGFEADVFLATAFCEL